MIENWKEVECRHRLVHLNRTGRYWPSTAWISSSRFEKSLQRVKRKRTLKIAIWLHYYMSFFNGAARPSFASSPLPAIFSNLCVLPIPQSNSIHEEKKKLSEISHVKTGESRWNISTYQSLPNGKNLWASNVPRLSRTWDKPCVHGFDNLSQ